MSAGVSRSFFTARSVWAQAKGTPDGRRLHASPAFNERHFDEIIAATPPWWERLFDARDAVSR